MTPEQIKELATLGANVQHILESLDELKDRLKALPEVMSQFARSKELEELSRTVAAMQRDIDDLKRGSPARIWDVAIKGASGVGIMWGFVALVRDYFQNGWHK